jgi:NO-binding membrane sensor protein with MHYT domain
MTAWAIVPIAWDWRYLAASAVLPLIGACLAAWPLWRLRQEILGSILGAGVALIFVIGFIGREYVSIQQATQTCIDTETPCAIRPAEFTRYAAYGLTGFLDVGVVFMMGLRADERRRRRESQDWW